MEEQHTLGFVRSKITVKHRFNSVFRPSWAFIYKLLKNFITYKEGILMNFEMVGKLSIGKDSEKFHPYQETKYDSGWVRKQLMFNATCGDNRHMLTVTAGAFADGHGDVYSFTKGAVDENGNKVKGESIKIPFKERLTSPKLAEIAEFKKSYYYKKKKK